MPYDPDQPVDPLDPGKGRWRPPKNLQETRTDAGKSIGFLDNTLAGVLLDGAGATFDPLNQGKKDARDALYNLKGDTAGDLNAFYNSQMPGLLAKAMPTQATNPYNAGIADQSRAAQLALIQQMRGQMNGPSIANMQGQRAMGQMGQQALMQGGRAGMLGAQGASAGMAGDVGQARLAEVMRAQAGMGGAAGALRGADLQSANAQAGAGLSAQEQADKNSQFYATQGANLGEAARRANLEQYKLYQRMVLEKQKAAMKTQSDVGNAFSTILDIIL